MKNKSDLFQFSMDNALEMILIFDDCGAIRYANRSAKEQLEYEEMHKCLITDIFPSGLSVKQEAASLHYEGGNELRDMMAYRRNRTCFPVKVRIIVYESEQQLCKAKRLYLCMAYNASTESFLEQKANRADREAEEAQKVKSEFVANVTHELRTPVNGILGNTQELMRSETREDKRKLLQLVERGCRDMNALIDNILDFSKLEAGKFTLEPRKFHFRNMMEYVKGNHFHKIIEKGLDFSMTVSDEIPEYIIGDELRIAQILNNLISNAYKFTSVGRIHVEAVKTAEIGNRAELFFLVMDTGIGIDKTQQDKLFKSFSQVDASISRKYGGTGLGLNICKQLVELMDGNIHVESDRGKGTMFSFHIWVEIPEDCRKAGEEKGKESGENSEKQIFLQKLQSLSENGVSEKIWQYGEAENREEIEKKISKLTLSMEMENWEKAEMFAETIKKLVEEAPREVKSVALRLKMSVQKGDYEKAMAELEKLQQMV